MNLPKIAASSLVTACAVFCGMFAPVALSSVRNTFWEPVFGAGFFVAGILLHPYAGNQMVGLVGFVAWPLVLASSIAFAAWRLTKASSRAGFVAGALFLLSLCLWVTTDAANRLAMHHVPFFSSLFFNWY